MATIWAPHIAPRIGRWAERAYATGWSHTIHFSSLEDLLRQMSGRTELRENAARQGPGTMRVPFPRLGGRVTRLGIVAHGDIDGLVQLDSPLTADTVRSFERVLQQFPSFLTQDAQVIFFSCIAGAGRDGDRLLNALSTSWPGRTVIGFTVWGETEATEAVAQFSPQSPGHVREAPHQEGSGRPGREGLLGPWNMYAKWSRNGTIVRRPITERDRQNHCANPRCPGHRSPLDHCPGWH
jgi:hypothetical protein